MAIIKVLTPHEAQKIAAGEIVERPAHIVKELIENSIDAGATQISCYIQSAGKKLIRIVDNGCGMEQDDALLCFARHATSKISCLDDLQALISFGFRGEALASIAAVSNISLTTKPIGSELGINVIYHAGNLMQQQSVACQQGTDITVMDLFAQLPARKKFLKQDDTEWNQIVNLFHAFCLSHLNIHFQLYQHDKLILNAPATTTLKDRACQIWDANLANNLIDLHGPSRHNLTWCNISGVISEHHVWRYNKAMFFFFVNNRWIKDIELSKAVMKGYQEVLPPGKFPVVFIKLSAEPTHVDINVHPKKEEVRFASQAQVSSLLQHLITTTLEQTLHKKIALPVFSQPTPRENRPSRFEILPPSVDRIPNKLESPTSNYLHQHANNSPIDPHPLPSSLTSTLLPKTQSIMASTDPITNSQEGKIIGQLFKTYIIIEYEDSCVIIDQHAAHERILYEQFKNKFIQREGTKLLFPLIVTLQNSMALERLLTEQTFFLQQGIMLEQFGAREIAITSCAPDLTNSDLVELLKECTDIMLEHEILDTEHMRKKLYEHVHSHLACKTAIKAGDLLSPDKMKNLVKTLSDTENKNICIHGRPTSWTLPKMEFEKKFRRK